MKLAIFSGTPAFEKPLVVGTPLIEKEVRERYFKMMQGVFDRNYFTNDGPLTRELEAEIARLHGVPHCVAMSSGTTGLMILIKALDLRGEVILPSFTFVATAHACQWQNLTPVFCDISPDTLTVDPSGAAALITERTSTILGVHLFARLCDVAGLREVCGEHDLALLFDAAHAFAVTHGDPSAGGFGDAEVLSFHATKFFGTFEGGAVLTHDPILAGRLRHMRNFGFRGYDDVGSLGINAKMSESSAAMGLASLTAIDSRRARLEKNHLRYLELLGALPGVRLLPPGVRRRCNYNYVVILLEDAFGVSRDVLYRVLWKENVLARRYFYPGCHRMEPYRSAAGTRAKLPVTEDVAGRILCLPSPLADSDECIDTVASILRTVHERAGDVRKWAEENGAGGIS